MVTHKTIAYNRHFYFPVCSIIRKRKGAYDRVGGYPLVEQPTSHTTVRTVRYTAVQ